MKQFSLQYQNLGLPGNGNKGTPFLKTGFHSFDGKTTSCRKSESEYFLIQYH